MMKSKRVAVVAALALVLALGLLGLPSTASASGSGGTRFLGQICLFANTNSKVPAGWTPCDGRALPIGSNTALFSVIGTVFGGNGSTFNLPDLRSAAPYSGTGGSGQYCMCTDGTAGVYTTFLIGEVCLLPDCVATSYTGLGPEIFLKCDGSAYDTADYSALYGVIGGAFGSNLPNLADVSPLSGLSYYIAYNGNYPGSAMGDSDYTGAVNLYAFGTAPNGTLLPCDGRSLAIASNAAIYNVIGTAYGGSGSNFCIPDFRGMKPLPGLLYMIVTGGVYPSYQ